jgi:hypothetical protein
MYDNWYSSFSSSWLVVVVAAPPPGTTCSRDRAGKRSPNDDVFCNDLHHHHDHRHYDYDYDEDDVPK